MARFAEIDANGIVQRVQVAPDMQWLVDRFGGTWVETFRDHATEAYAGVGYKDVRHLDPQAWVPPWTQPYNADAGLPLGVWRHHNGGVWESLVDGNISEPGIADWELKG